MATDLPDPTFGHKKTLRVEYVLDGKKGVKTVFDNEILEIGARGRRPAFDLTLAEDGKLQIHAWQSGVVEWQTAAGKSGKAEAEGCSPTREDRRPLGIAIPAQRRRTGTGDAGEADFLERTRRSGREVFLGHGDVS